MADVFQLQGSFASTPIGSFPSCDPVISSPISETLQLGDKDAQSYTLAADAPVNVALGDMAAVGAHVVIIRATGGKVRARITTADGATQAVPVDPLHILISQSVPVTAIDLTRVAGTLTTVKVFLGQKA